MSDKWKEWNKKRPKDSQYDSDAWSGDQSDYEKAQEGAKKGGFFENLKKSFSSKDEEEAKKKKSY